MPYTLTDRVRVFAKETFSVADLPEALRLLETTPLHGEQDDSTLEVIHVGLLKMAKGQLSCLRSSLEYFDFRDAIYAYHGVDWDEEMRKGNLWTPDKKYPNDRNA